MGKDFAIVPIEDIKPDIIYKAIESEMRIEKITVSKNNRIVIGIDKNIMFDINKNFIKWLSSYYKKIWKSIFNSSIR